MATIRRIVIDQDHPDGTWTDPEFEGYPYSQLFFSGPYYKVHLSTPVAVSAEFFDPSIGYVTESRAAVSDIYVWSAGFISFEVPTAEQVAFAAQYLAGERSILEFPGAAGAADLVSAGIPTYNQTSFYFQPSLYGYYITWGDPIEDATQGDFESEDAGEVFIGYQGGFSIDTGGDGLTDSIPAQRIGGYGYVAIPSNQTDANQTGAAGDDQIVGPDNTYDYNSHVLRGMAGDDYVTIYNGSAWVEGGAGSDLIGLFAEDYFTHYDNVPMTVDLALGTASHFYGTMTLIGVEAAFTGGGNDTLRAGDRYGNGVDIEKPTAVHNSGIASALSLDGRFGLGSDPEIDSSTTIPHATVVAHGSGFQEFYSFTVTQSGSSLTIDIDHSTLDTEVALLDANGAVLAFNDDAPIDPGSANGLNSFLVFEIATPGQYYIRVSQYPGQAVPLGGTYTLNVSLEGGRDVPISYALYGSNGDDLLISGTGDDILDGGNVFGRDTASYSEASGGVVVNLATGLATGHGNDQLVNIDAIEGSEFNDQITGDGLANVLNGNGGNDTIYGGAGNDALYGANGIDTVYGGTGDDVISVQSAGDVVIEYAGEGNDRVTAFVSYVLSGGAEIETIETDTYTGTGTINLTGNGTAQTILGNNGANYLDGQGGADTLHGFGGNDYLYGAIGFDNMYGGAGDDRFYIATDEGDRVWEFAGEGYDTVSTEVNYTLPDVAYVERLEAGTLTATSALYLGGSNFDNLIIGNAGNNTLRGFLGNDTLQGLGGDDALIGDEGADVMYGGTGNDTFYVNTSDDRIFENPGEGTNDRVATSVSFTLPNEAEVEVIEAVNLTGTSIGELGGSSYANTITGDAGNNVLRGYGGNDTLTGYLGNDTLIGDQGNDTMYGGAGNDAYFVDAAGDTVVESAGEGTSDRVATSVSYALNASAEIEIFETTSLTGTGAIDLTGSNTGNALIGNNGANTLDGRGGSDVITGAGGADTFQFTAALGAGNVDSIQDMTPSADKIALDDAVFAGLSPGALAAGAFVIGSAAADASDRIIYNSTTGALFYDADGNGAGAAVQFATLTGNPAVTASDFLVI